MIINNEDIFRTALKGRPTIKINKKLALQMKWFVEDGGQHYNMKMGPNLTMSLYEDEVPDVLDVIDDVYGQTSFGK